MNNKFENILVTGGLGFIGSNFLNEILYTEQIFKRTINLDKNSYYSNKNFLNNQSNLGYEYIKEDINNNRRALSILKDNKIDLVVHFAAESHVDRSIANPSDFITTNINGTFQLLEACKEYLKDSSLNNFKFIHVSTDEVYGSLGPSDVPFKEDNPYIPNSPYAASKASSDLLVRSYCQTYNFPAVITNCSNNYGPYQYPEKLIPLVINNCLLKKPIPIYGDGMQIRDWLHVFDHCRAILTIIKKGKIGEKYNIGGNHEITNLELVKKICKILDELNPNGEFEYKNLISFVKDRPGHDVRYSIDCRKIKDELNWEPSVDFNKGIRKTIQWYLENKDWKRKTQNNDFKEWENINYQNRI